MKAIVRLRYAAKTDVGMKRAHNEDYFSLIEDEKVFLVATSLELIQAIRRDYGDLYVILITALARPTPRSRRARSAPTITWLNRSTLRS